MPAVKTRSVGYEKRTSDENANGVCGRLGAVHAPSSEGRRPAFVCWNGHGARMRPRGGTSGVLRVAEPSARSQANASALRAMMVPGTVVKSRAVWTRLASTPRAD